MSTAEDRRLDAEVTQMRWRAACIRAERRGVPAPPSPLARNVAIFSGSDAADIADFGGGINGDSGPKILAVHGPANARGVFLKPQAQVDAELEIEVRRLKARRASSGRTIALHARAPHGATPPAPGGDDPWLVNGRLPEREVALRAEMKRQMSPTEYEARMALRAANLRSEIAADRTYEPASRRSAKQSRPLSKVALAAGGLTSLHRAILAETERLISGRR